MTTRRANLLLRTLGVASLAAAVAVLALAAIVPRAKATRAAVAPAAPTTRRAGVDAMPTTRAFAAVGAPTLRRSLADAPKLATPAVDPTKVPASMGLTLCGTILEPGRSLAVFATPAGETKLCAVGERVGGEGGGGGEVVAITAADVTLRDVDGRPVVLRVPAPPAVTPTPAAGT